MGRPRKTQNQKLMAKKANAVNMANLDKTLLTMNKEPEKKRLCGARDDSPSVAPGNRADVAQATQAVVGLTNRADVEPANRADVEPGNRADVAPATQADVGLTNRADVAQANRADVGPANRADAVSASYFPGKPVVRSSGSVSKKSAFASASENEVCAAAPQSVGCNASNERPGPSRAPMAPLARFVAQSTSRCHDSSLEDLFQGFRETQSATQTEKVFMELKETIDQQSVQIDELLAENAQIRKLNLHLQESLVAARENDTSSAGPDELQAENAQIRNLNLHLQESLVAARGNDTTFAELEGYPSAEWLLSASQNADDSDYLFIKELMFRLFPAGVGNATATGRPSNNPKGRNKEGEDKEPGMMEVSKLDEEKLKYMKDRLYERRRILQDPLGVAYSKSQKINKHIGNVIANNPSLRNLRKQ